MACYGVRGEVPVGDYVVELGKADIKRSGRDATVVTYGRGVFDSLQAAEQLAADGIDVEVLDLRTLVPLDMATVAESVGRTGRAVVAHYATEFAGPGAELAAQIDRIAARGTHGLFLKAPDVPEIAAALDRLTARGAPVVTLVTDIASSTMFAPANGSRS